MKSALEKFIIDRKGKSEQRQRRLPEQSFELVIGFKQASINFIFFFFNVKA